ncbi:unnamed protein product, partial [Polarella glacialis]
VLAAGSVLSALCLRSARRETYSRRARKLRAVPTTTADPPTTAATTATTATTTTTTIARTATTATTTITTITSTLTSAATTSITTLTSAVPFLLRVVRAFERLAGRELKNSFLDGNFAPVSAEVTAEKLQVIEGAIPADFPDGMFVRNGPNPRFRPDTMEAPFLGRTAHHWFEGDGMLHVVRIEGGVSSYRNRYIRTDDFQREQAAGQCLYRGIVDTTSLASVVNPLMNLAVFGSAAKNVANTSVIYHGGRLLALVEGETMPAEICMDSLGYLGNYNFGRQEPLPSFTAHPKVDPVTGEMIFAAYSLSEPPVHVGVVGADGNLKHWSTVKSAERKTLMHDCAITERFTLILDFPLTIDVGRSLRGGQMLDFEDAPSRIGVMPRFGSDPSSDVLRWFSFSPGYGFHMLNAFECGDEACFGGFHFGLIFCGLHALGGFLTLSPPQYEPALDRRAVENIAAVAMVFYNPTALSAVRHLCCYLLAATPYSRTAGADSHAHNDAIHATVHRALAATAPPSVLADPRGLLPDGLEVNGNLGRDKDFGNFAYGKYGNLGSYNVNGNLDSDGSDDDGPPPLCDSSGEEDVDGYEDLYSTTSGDSTDHEDDDSIIMMVDGEGGVPVQPPPPMATPAPTRSSIDLIKLGKPSTFAGKESDWPEWSFVARSFIHLAELFSPSDLRAVELRPAEIRFSTLNADERARSSQLYYILALFLRGRALTILRKVEAPNGAEAWRALAREIERRDEISSAGLLQAIMSFDFGASLVGVPAKLNEFEILVVRPVSYLDLRRTIDDYLRAKSVWRPTSVTGTHATSSNATSPTPMDVDSVGKGFGRGGGKGAGRDQQKRDDARGGRDKLSGEQRSRKYTFDGDCRFCACYGHRESECRKKKKADGASSSASSSRSGPSSSTPRVQVKGKGKRKIHEVSAEQTQLPEPEPQVSSLWPWQEEENFVIAVEPQELVNSTSACALGGCSAVLNSRPRPGEDGAVEILLDSGCFQDICPQSFAPRIPASTAADFPRAHLADGSPAHCLGTKVVPLGLKDEDDEEVILTRTFSVMNVLRPILSLGGLRDEGIGLRQLLPLLAPVTGSEGEDPEGTAEGTAPVDETEGPLLNSEAQAPRMPAVPASPSAEERGRHELTHMPFRTWCRACVVGRGHTAPHRRVPRPRAGAAVQMDHAFPGGFRVLALAEAETGYGAATAICAKGSADTYAVAFGNRFLDEIGYPEVAILTDPEPAVIDLARAIAGKSNRRVEVMQTGRASYGSIGVVDKYIQTVEALLRTFNVEITYRMTLENDRVLLPWAARHAGWTVTRFQVRPSGLTAWAILKTVPYVSDVCAFAETVLIKAGLVRSRTIRRREATEQRSLALLSKVKGLPWAPKGLHLAPPLALGSPAEADVRATPAPSGPSSRRSEGRPQGQEIRAFLGGAGRTPGCRACIEPRNHRRSAACVRRRAAWQEARQDISVEGEMPPQEPANTSADTAAQGRAAKRRRDASDAELLAISDAAEADPLAGGAATATGVPETMDVSRKPGTRKEPPEADEASAASRRRIEMLELDRMPRDKLREEFPVCEDENEIKLDIADETVQEFVIQDELQLQQTAETLGYTTEELRRAIVNELTSIADFHTRDEIDEKEVQAGERVIGTVLVIVRKPSAGACKARICAQDIAKRGGKRDDLYSPTPATVSVRVLLKRAERFRVRFPEADWIVRIGDFSTAFLHAVLGPADGDRVVVRAPSIIRRPGKLWRLKKALYGLRKAPAFWAEQFATAMVDKLGFKRLQSDRTYFYRKDRRCDVVVHVDDPIVAGPDTSVSLLFELFQGSMKFKPGEVISELKSVRYLGGFKVRAGPGYIDGVLKDVQLSTCRGASTPATTAAKPSTPEEKQMRREQVGPDSHHMFRHETGKLRFLVSKRPDLLYATKSASYALAGPTVEDWTKLKRALRYLKQYPDAWLLLELDEAAHRNPAAVNRIDVYVDTDYASADSRKSTTCLVVKLNGMTIHTSDKTQSTIATSSGGAELYGIGSGVVEGLGVRSLLLELDEEVELTVHFDSSAARTMAQRQGLGSMKHVEVKYLWVQQILKMGKAKVKAVRTTENLADIGTKPLDAARLRYLSQLCGLQFDEADNDLIETNAACEARVGYFRASSRYLRQRMVLAWGDDNFGYTTFSLFELFYKPRRARTMAEEAFAVWDGMANEERREGVPTPGGCFAEQEGGGGGVAVGGAYVDANYSSSGGNGPGEEQRIEETDVGDTTARGVVTEDARRWSDDEGSRNDEGEEEPDEVEFAGGNGSDGGADLSGYQARGLNRREPPWRRADREGVGDSGSADSSERSGGLGWRSDTVGDVLGSGDDGTVDPEMRVMKRKLSKLLSTFPEGDAGPKVLGRLGCLFERLSFGDPEHFVVHAAGGCQGFLDISERGLVIVTLKHADPQKSGHVFKTNIGGTSSRRARILEVTEIQGGVGGGAVGALAAGYRPKLSVDNNERAIRAASEIAAHDHLWTKPESAEAHFAVLSAGSGTIVAGLDAGTLVTVLRLGWLSNADCMVLDCDRENATDNVLSLVDEYLGIMGQQGSEKVIDLHAIVPLKRSHWYFVSRSDIFSEPNLGGWPSCQVGQQIPLQGFRRYDGVPDLRHDWTADEKEHWRGTRTNPRAVARLMGFPVTEGEQDLRTMVRLYGRRSAPLEVAWVLGALRDGLDQANGQPHQRMAIKTVFSDARLPDLRGLVGTMSPDWNWWLRVVQDGSSYMVRVEPTAKVEEVVRAHKMMSRDDDMLEARNGQRALGGDERLIECADYGERKERSRCIWIVTRERSPSRDSSQERVMIADALPMGAGEGRIEKVQRRFIQDEFMNCFEKYGDYCGQEFEDGERISDTTIMEWAHFSLIVTGTILGCDASFEVIDPGASREWVDFPERHELKEDKSYLMKYAGNQGKGMIDCLLEELNGDLYVEDVDWQWLPQQENDFDCGLFMMLRLWQLLAGRSPKKVTQKAASALRRTVKELLEDARRCRPIHTGEAELVKDTGKKTKVEVYCEITEQQKQVKKVMVLGDDFDEDELMKEVFRVADNEFSRQFRQPAIQNGKRKYYLQVEGTRVLMMEWDVLPRVQKITFRMVQVLRGGAMEGATDPWLRGRTAEPIQSKLGAGKGEKVKGGAKNEMKEQISLKLREILSQKGVSAEDVATRVDDVITQVGIKKLGKVFEKQEPWPALLAEVKSRPNLRLLTLEELQKKVPKDTLRKQEVTDGWEESKASKKVGEVDVRSIYHIPEGMLTAGGRPLPTLGVSDFKRNAHGVLLMTKSEAQERIQETGLMSVDALVILTIGLCDPGHSCPGVSFEHRGFELIHAATGGSVSVKGTVINLGETKATVSAPVHEVHMEPSPSKIVRITIYKRCAEVNFGSCKNKEGKMYHGKEGPVVAIWGRTFTNSRGDRTDPVKAYKFYCKIRIVDEVFSDTLDAGSQRGAHVEPVMESGRGDDITVIWLRGPAQQIKRKALDVEGKVTVAFNGSSYGLRCKVEGAIALKKQLYPGKDEADLLVVCKRWKMGPFPYSFAKADVGVYLEESWLDGTTADRSRKRHLDRRHLTTGGWENWNAGRRTERQEEKKGGGDEDVNMAARAETGPGPVQQKLQHIEDVMTQKMHEALENAKEKFGDRSDERSQKSDQRMEGLELKLVQIAKHVENNGATEAYNRMAEQQRAFEERITAMTQECHKEQRGLQGAILEVQAHVGRLVDMEARMDEKLLLAIQASQSAMLAQTAELKDHFSAGKTGKKGGTGMGASKIGGRSGGGRFLGSGSSVRLVYLVAFFLQTAMGVGEAGVIGLGSGEGRDGREAVGFGDVARSQDGAPQGDDIGVKHDDLKNKDAGRIGVSRLLEGFRSGGPCWAGYRDGLCGGAAGAGNYVMESETLGVKHPGRDDLRARGPGTDGKDRAGAGSNGCDHFGAECDERLERFRARFLDLAALLADIVGKECTESGSPEGTNRWISQGDPQIRLHEWRMNLVTGDLGPPAFMDFPTVSPKVVGRENEFGYFAPFAKEPSLRAGVGVSNSLRKYRFSSEQPQQEQQQQQGQHGEVGFPQVHQLRQHGGVSSEEHHYGEGVSGQEGIFVPRPGGVKEDDGWLLVFTFDEAAAANGGHHSELRIIDAQNFSGPPAARIALPQRVPYGFHGTFVPL